MNTGPSVIGFALLIGLSFFLGLAFEDFFAQAPMRRPGGVRTFPMLALAGGLLYLLDPTHLIAFTTGLLLLGFWLTLYYREHIREHDDPGESGVGLVIVLLNVHAYLLGAVALALPNWVAIATTVGAVLLLTNRDRLHALARRVEMKEIITAGEFLILTGIILPLLPAEPVTHFTDITPRQVWLALVVVCSLSYASYLAQRYWTPAAGGLWTAALGGLYSSTATTIVLAQQAKADAAMRPRAQAGITLATALMYLRILAIIAVFNLELARRVMIPLVALSALGLVFCALQTWLSKPPEKAEQVSVASSNPLAIGSAAIFAALFVAVSLLSHWVVNDFGINGVYTLAAVIGFADIDPFVLNLAQGGTSVPTEAIASAILIASSSNNVLKACYAALFGGGLRAALPSVATLVILAAAGVAVALGLIIVA
jgi:uncharacterized membrane protein (DUF4010 family)